MDLAGFTPASVVDRFLQVRIGERPYSDLASVPTNVVEYLDSVYHRNRFKVQLPMRPESVS